MTSPTSSSNLPIDPSGLGSPPGQDPRFGNEAIAPYFFIVIFGAALFAVGYVLFPFFGDMVIALVAVLLLSRFYERLNLAHQREWTVSLRKNAIAGWASK